MTTSTERLNKYIALHAGLSRRAADELIEAGKVTVNGVPASLGGRVAATDTVQINGAPLEHIQQKTYLLFHKPVGYVCSRKQQGNADTIYSLLPKKYHALKPVGRLDKDSSGLLLLTNDGEFAHQMTHPKFHKAKVYEVRLTRDLEPLHQQMIADHGISLDDGTSSFQLERLSDSNRTDWRIIMYEGRNRQIRRTFAALGYTVTALHRTQFGNYALGDITPGKFKAADISPSA